MNTTEPAQLLLQSSDDREPYNDISPYSKYQSDMFFLKTLSKSVVEICNEREKFYSKVHIYVDFTTGRYYVMFYSSDVKQGMTDINKERDIFATYTYENDLDKVTGDPYDLYLSLKLKYDNTLRAKQYRELIQAQRKRILNAR